MPLQRRTKMATDAWVTLCAEKWTLLPVQLGLLDLLPEGSLDEGGNLIHRYSRCQLRIAVRPDQRTCYNRLINEAMLFEWGDSKHGIMRKFMDHLYSLEVCGPLPGLTARQCLVYTTHLSPAPV